LKPLGNPPPDGIKSFATAEVFGNGQRPFLAGKDDEHNCPALAQKAPAKGAVAARKTGIHGSATATKRPWRLK
jgi:hypothetical protein